MPGTERQRPTWKTFVAPLRKPYKKQRRGRGGTGRRKGLKIPRWQRRVGSSPTARTNGRCRTANAPKVDPLRRQWTGSINVLNLTAPARLRAFEQYPLKNC